MRVGTRVRLRPRPDADEAGAALAGRTAVVDAIERDMEGRERLAVLVDDAPGRDLGGGGQRYFVLPSEVEPLRRVLVAGVGNLLLGDDGFGVVLAHRLAKREWPEHVTIVDYGIRGMDLAFALGDYEAAVLLDATPRGSAPGTLHVIEPERDQLEGAHGISSLKVLALARAFGGRPAHTLVLGCEPGPIDPDRVVTELSPPVRAALDAAERLVAELLEDFTRTEAAALPA